MDEEERANIICNYFADKSIEDIENKVDNLSDKLSTDLANIKYNFLDISDDLSSSIDRYEEQQEESNRKIEALFILLSNLYRSQYKKKYLIIQFSNGVNFCGKNRIYIGQFVKIKPVSSLSYKYTGSDVMICGTERTIRFPYSSITEMQIIDFKDKDSAVLYAEVSD